MTKSSQIEKAAKLAAMHRGDDVLVLPNAWDVASARVLVECLLKRDDDDDNHDDEDEEHHCRCSGTGTGSKGPLEADIDNHDDDIDIS